MKLSKKYKEYIIWARDIILLVQAKGTNTILLALKKDEDGMVCIYMEGEELEFTVKEAKEIAEKLKSAQMSDIINKRGDTYSVSPSSFLSLVNLEIW